MNTRRFDPGLEVTEHAFTRMEGIAKNAVRLERGFVWENGGIPQSVWAEEPVEDAGALVSRVHAETLFASGVPGTPEVAVRLARYAEDAGLSGPVRSPGGDVSLKTTVFAHEGNLPEVRLLLSTALAVQAIESCTMSAVLADHTGGTPAGPTDPLSPGRPETRDWLARAGDCFSFVNSGERPWNTETFYGAVKEFIGNRSLHTSTGRDGLTAEYPYGPGSGPAGSGGHSVLFRMFGDLTHPLLGDGIKFLLVLPMPLPGPEGGELAGDLNAMEQREWNRCHFLGSWHLDRLGFPAFNCFIPAIACHPALVLNQVIAFGIRSAWAASIGIRQNSQSPPGERGRR